MTSDLQAIRFRLGTNPQAPGFSADFLGGKNDTAGRLVFQLNGYGTAADGPYMGVGHARGTVAAPANNVDGDNLGDFEFYAYAGGWQQAAEIRSHVTGAVVDGVTPSTNMTFKVATGGAMVIRQQIFSTGRIGIGSASRATETEAAANGAGALWAAENNSITPIAFHYSASNSNSGVLLGRKSRGTISAPTTVQNGDGLSAFRAGAYTGTWFDDCAYAQFAIDFAPVANQRPAVRFEVAVNQNNSAASLAFRIGSDKKFYMGQSVTAVTDAKFNYSLAGGVEEVVATYQQAGGFPNSMVIGFSTYDTGYTNGHPARIYVGDNQFSCYFRFDHKKINAASNTLVPSLLLTASTNAANAAFFDNTGSFGNGQGVIYIANRNTAPTANPSNGGVLYAEGGALKWRGSAGTVTTIANA